MKILKRILPALMWALVLLGVLTVFRACAAKEDGSFMNCHNAQTAAAVLSGIGIVGNLVCLRIKGKVGGAIDFGVNLICALLMMLLPQNVIHLCMMPEMRCRMWMRPWLLVTGAIIIVAAVARGIHMLRKR